MKQTNDEMEAEYELKFEACLIESEEWWNKLEDDERVTLYLRNREKDILEDKEEATTKLIKEIKDKIEKFIYKLEGDGLDVAKMWKWLSEKEKEFQSLQEISMRKPNKLETLKIKKRRS
ncbi:MAG: hypothetical protein AABY22_09715 [Nanoarchaeota archaeon]